MIANIPIPQDNVEWRCAECGRDLLFEPHTPSCTLGIIAPPKLNVQQPTKGEVTVTDTKTGGQKGMKKVRFSLIPHEALWALATHYGICTPEFGGKYAPKNWEKGYAWSLGEDALFRHYYLWKSGQSYDTGEGGSGTHHLICVIWHAISLYIFQTRMLGTDDLRVHTGVPDV